MIKIIYHITLGWILDGYGMFSHNTKKKNEIPTWDDRSQPITIIKQTANQKHIVNIIGSNYSSSNAHVPLKLCN